MIVGFISCTFDDFEPYVKQNLPSISQVGAVVVELASTAPVAVAAEA